MSNICYIVARSAVSDVSGLLSLDVFEQLEDAEAEYDRLRTFYNVNEHYKYFSRNNSYEIVLNIREVN